MPTENLMPLAHSSVIDANAKPTSFAAFLHGLLGQGSNWQGFARRLVAARPQWGALLLDLRMHGASQHLSPPHTLRNAAQDVRDTLLQVNEPSRAVIGHSLGGKLALLLLQEPPSGLREVWVLDASPSARGPRGEGDVTQRVVAALAALPARFESRAQFRAELGARGVNEALAAWLAKNLVREDDGLRFGLDLDAIAELLAEHDRTDAWELVESPPPGIALRFVLGGRSHSVSADDRERLRGAAACGAVEIFELPTSGHWLHVDDPEGLLEVLVSHLGRTGLAQTGTR